MVQMRSQRKNIRHCSCAFGTISRILWLYYSQCLGIVTYITGDVPGTVVIFMMVLLGIVLRYFQESRADSAAEKLKAMVSTTATVMRDGKRQEIELKNLVPGDIVLLSAGDMSPADVRLLSARDLFLNQAALTGESMPVEKIPAVVAASGE